MGGQLRVEVRVICVAMAEQRSSAQSQGARRRELVVVLISRSPTTRLGPPLDAQDGLGAWSGAGHGLWLPRTRSARLADSTLAEHRVRLPCPPPSPRPSLLLPRLTFSTCARSLVSDYFYPKAGGVESHIYAVAQSLAKRNHRVRSLLSLALSATSASLDS